ncbi:sigma-70 family RNA polymerase sigma factor [Intestinibacter sp.]
MDEKLVKKAIRGNFNAYSILVHSIKNEQDSIDAYLQAVEKGLKNIKNLNEPQYFKTWFLKIVINEANSIISKNKKVICFEEVENVKQSGSKLKDKEAKLDLERSLEKLEPQVREMIRLKFYMGYKLDEIAEILKVPVGTVKGKMYSALKSMKKDLEVK